MSAVRAIHRVGSASTHALRAMDHLQQAHASARVAGAGAAQSAGVGTGSTNGVRTPAVSFGQVLAATGTAGPADDGLQRALDLYLHERTLDCQEQLAAQRHGDQARASADLRDRLEAALDEGGAVRVRPSRPRRLPGPPLLLAAP